MGNFFSSPSAAPAPVEPTTPAIGARRKSRSTRTSTVRGSKTKRSRSGKKSNRS